jgi:hypothetical protein
MQHLKLNIIGLIALSDHFKRGQISRFIIIQCSHVWRETLRRGAMYQRCIRETSHKSWSGVSRRLMGVISQNDQGRFRLGFQEGDGGFPEKTLTAMLRAWWAGMRPLSGHENCQRVPAALCRWLSGCGRDQHALFWINSRSHVAS